MSCLICSRKNERFPFPTPVSRLRKGDAVATIQTRIRLLQQIVESVVVTHAPSGNRDRVCFGASVLLRHGDGQEATYRIVGIDETDLERGHISLAFTFGSGAAFTRHR